MDLLIIHLSFKVVKTIFQSLFKLLKSTLNKIALKLFSFKHFVQ
jgi:hypothetical protein